MTLEQVKQELIKRYKYLYENASFILAPFMYKHEETNFIYLNINLENNINSLFEELLLSDKPLEESTLYKMIEENKDNKDYLEKVKNGLDLVEEKNKEEKEEYLLALFGIKLDLYKILGLVSDYIKEQSNDLDNKKDKLFVIDEYYRILRYQNNGKIYKSGLNLTLDESCGGIFIEPVSIPSRDKGDIGVVKNKFITTIVNIPPFEYNRSIFTEEEKQEIYLQYHDELPHDLTIKCTLEEEYIETLIDSRLQRPDNTACCDKEFYINESEIFINPDDTLYRYYQLCPHCGYIVNIPKEILSDGIKKRIEERCSKDNDLFRKMYLYSELFSLDSKTPKGHRRILTNPKQ